MKNTKTLKTRTPKFQHITRCLAIPFCMFSLMLAQSYAAADGSPAADYEEENAAMAMDSGNFYEAPEADTPRYEFGFGDGSYGSSNEQAVPEADPDSEIPALDGMYLPEDMQKELEANAQAEAELEGGNPAILPQPELDPTQQPQPSGTDFGKVVFEDNSAEIPGGNFGNPAEDARIKNKLDHESKEQAEILHPTEGFGIRADEKVLDRKKASNASSGNRKGDSIHSIPPQDRDAGSAKQKASNASSKSRQEEIDGSSQAEIDGLFGLSDKFMSN